MPGKTQREVILLGTRFEKVSSGLSDYSSELASSLKRYSNYKITCLAPKRYVKKLPFVKRGGVYNVINHTLFYSLSREKLILNNKNVHAVSVGELPLSLYNKPNKKIVTVHDFYNLDPKLLMKPKHMLFLQTTGKRFLGGFVRLNEFDHVITISEIIAQLIENLLYIDKSKISVVPDIIDTDRFKKIKKEKSNKTVIGYINSFGAHKLAKLEAFIKIFKQIKDDNLEFRIYGSGFPRIDLIADDKRIKYFGRLDESVIVDTYNDFDVYLQTSTREGFGIPVVKAKACEVPVLCYNGSLPDIVKRNTVLWREDNLKSLIESEAWKKISVKKARKDAELCSPKTVANKITSIYDEVFYNKR